MPVTKRITSSEGIPMGIDLPLILEGKSIPRYIVLGCIYNYLGSKSKTIYNSKASFLCHEFIFLTFLPVLFLDQKNPII